jgi:hypothetical protein
MHRTARRLLLLSGAVVVVALAVLGYLWFSGRDPGSAATSSGAGASPGSPGTAGASASTAPDLPTDVPEPSPGQPLATDSAAPTSGGDVSVLLTYAAWNAPAGASAEDSKSGSVQLNGLVSGVIEDGGTCRATLTHGATTVTGEAKGMADAKATDCAVTVTDARLTPGTWKVVLSYRSSTSNGTSSSTDVTVLAR